MAAPPQTESETAQSPCLASMAQSSKTLVAIVTAGILLRIVVFAFQGPFNNDKHFEVVRYVHEHGTVPAADELNQAYQPPLYYVLAAPLLHMGGRKTVQAFSLALSIGTLLVLFVLLGDLPLTSPTSRAVSLSLPAFLPQFVMYGNYISNDCLTFFLGSLLFLQLWRCFRCPSSPRLFLLAVCLGVGLLTKATFLAFVPVLALFAHLLSRKAGAPPRRAVLVLALFLTLSSAVGCYKYVHNLRHMGRALVTNVNEEELWVRSQRPTNTGVESFVDVNILRLVRYPTVSGHTVHSYPLLFYGSFWYQFIPESNFRGNMTGLRAIGSAIYLAAFPVSLLMLTGFVRIACTLWHPAGPSGQDGREIPARAFKLAAVLLTLANVALLMAAGLKYDVWTIFQSRSFFASMAGLAIMLDAGYGLVAGSRCPRLHAFIAASLVLLLALAAAYFVSEIVLVVRHPPAPSMDYFLTYPVDMRVNL